MARTLIRLKYLLLCCVVLLGFLGAIVSAAAAFFIYELYEYGFLTPQNVCGPPTIVLIMGLLICLISWCGCQIMDFSNRTQITSFVVFLALITFVHGVSGIWAIAKHERIEKLPATTLQKFKVEMILGKNKHFWDYTQSKLHCCGVTGFKDYQNAFPRSCYDDASEIKLAEEGCIYPVFLHTKSILLRIFLLALCLVVVEIFLLIINIWYLRVMKECYIKQKKLAVLAARSFTRCTSKQDLNAHLSSTTSKCSNSHQVP